MKIKNILLSFIPMMGMMVGCGGCDGDIANFPTPVQGFNTGTKLQRGGITGVAFLKCDSPFTDPLDQTEWQAKIDSNDLVIRKDCGISGTKESASEKEEVGACRVEVVKDRLHTITLTDRFDNTDYDVASLYINFQVNPTDYLVAIITCDGVVYPFEKVTIDPNKNIEETTDGVTSWGVTATYRRLDDQKPLNLAFDIDDLTFA